ncbi:MAG: hypothetical protein XU11_C0014G0058 [Candidatus Dadabacteria bacterium CSP1-2]|nr:MAG: hypothetical protein XU11_C0014G0058 [Candidatus Dadabacteria bacterium CSP1-2]MBF8302749.1 hypothetical protein [Candidatus Dadabacteria bacterium]
MKTVKFLLVATLITLSLATVGFGQQAGEGWRGGGRHGGGGGQGGWHGGRGGHGGGWHGGHGGWRGGHGGGWHGYYPNQFYFNLGIPFISPYYYPYGNYQPYYPPYQYYPQYYPYGAYPYMNFGFQLYGH